MTCSLYINTEKNLTYKEVWNQNIIPIYTITVVFKPLLASSPAYYVNTATYLYNSPPRHTTTATTTKQRSLLAEVK